MEKNGKIGRHQYGVMLDIYIGIIRTENFEQRAYIILKNEPVPHYIWRNHIIFLDSAFPLYAQSSNKYLSIKSIMPVDGTTR